MSHLKALAQRFVEDDLSAEDQQKLIIDAAECKIHRTMNSLKYLLTVWCVAFRCGIQPGSKRQQWDISCGAGLVNPTLDVQRRI